MNLVLLSLLACGEAEPAPPPAPPPVQEPAPAEVVEAPATQQPATIAVSSTAFAMEGEIPTPYTCEGADAFPPLSWSHLPEGTVSLALVVVDPDAPDPADPKTTWTHLVAYDLPATTTSLAEGELTLPEGASFALNDWGKPAWGGPCPPVGRHRYYFHVYALDTTLGDLGQADRAAVEAALSGHVLDQGVLMGTYEK